MGVGEHASAKTQAMLSEHGTTFTPVAPESQFQNGSAERYVGEIKRMTKKLLSRADVSEKLWCHAVAWAADRIAAWPACDGKSMHESFCGTKKSLKHNMEFGTVALCRATAAHKHRGAFGIHKKKKCILGLMMNF